MVGELAGDRRGSTRFNGGQPQGVVTPRAEIDPQRYEIAKLGETKQFADDIRSQVAEKSRELAEMNEGLMAFGHSLPANAARIAAFDLTILAKGVRTRRWARAR